MKLLKVSLVSSLIFISLSVNANEFVNGWTQETAKEFVETCAASGVSKNMKHLLDNKVIVAKTEKYKSTLKEVTFYQAAVCDCTQANIMKDYQFTEIAKMMSNKEYIIKVAKKCSSQLLQTNK